MNPRNGCPTGRVPTKGMSGKRDIRGGGVLARQAGLLKSSRAGDLSGLGAAAVDWMFLPFSHIVKGNCRRNAPRSNFIKSVKLTIEKTS